MNFAKQVSGVAVAGMLSLLVGATSPSLALAQEPTPVQSVAAEAEKRPMTEAEVKKVDRESGKLTLKHAEIKNLDMPPMTMVFRVKDKALLDGVKVGDKIKFAADKLNGNYTVTAVDSKK